MPNLNFFKIKYESVDFERRIRGKWMKILGSGADNSAGTYIYILRDGNEKKSSVNRQTKNATRLL